MKIVIDAEPKEIAALVLAVQERQMLDCVKLTQSILKEVNHRQGKQDSDSQASEQ